MKTTNRVQVQQISDRVHKKLCAVLEKGTKTPKKELLKTLELIYQEWDYIQRGE